MDPEHTTASLPGPSELLTSVINQLSTIDPEPATDSTTVSGIYNPLSSCRPDVQSKAKSLLLTLHCLFPNELLLALDTLDKKLVTKCRISSSGTQQPPQQQRHDKDRRQDVYFVRSQSSVSSSSSSSSSTAMPVAGAAGASEGTIGSSYEVHLHSWNCTCPAFTLAMVRELSWDDAGDEDDEQNAYGSSERGISDRNTADDWIFGGSLTKRPTAGRRLDGSGQSSASLSHDPTTSAASPRSVCCKHLLACVLAARCPRLFASGVREVGIDLGPPTSTDVAGIRGGNGKEKYEVAAWHAGYGG